MRTTIRFPRIFALALFISRHDDVSVAELTAEGFPKPDVYLLLGTLEEHGIITVEPARSKDSNRYVQTFSVTPKGKALASHLAEIEKTLGHRI